MQPRDRYDSSDLDESHYEPGSRRRVLKNLRGITSKREMDQLEGREQVRALEDLATFYGKDHRFTAADICRIHTLWLGGLYAWAGRYRQVNVKKGTFSFAAAALIPKLMVKFEEGAAQTSHALSLDLKGNSCCGAGRGSRGTRVDSSFQGRQWSSGAATGRTHGTTSRIASPLL